PEPDEPESSSGCGCGTASGADAVLPWLLLALLGLSAFPGARRRRGPGVH
ncbi:MYXO-CTERM sorting domain-containing protein, partial [Pyxidicoccus fallax]